MSEERRQKLLETYGIGVSKLMYHPKKDVGMWFGCFNVLLDYYETDNFKTRREDEDQAIADYEAISETGSK